MNLQPSIIRIKAVAHKEVLGYDAEQITKLAESILEVGGSIRPLLVKRTGIESYEVIGNDIIYYAAKRAAELDSRKGSTINAYIAEDDDEAELLRKQMGMMF